jgi:Methylase involved in ubiquinone/menaquinone biosynthesis
LVFGTAGLALLLAAGGLLYSFGPDERRGQAAPAPPDTTDTSGVYSQRAPSRNGIGKVYMGREISKVMGHRGANWLERPARAEKERPDLLVDSLPLGPSDTVADIGAGTGYLSFRVAPRVPQGNILAVDIQPEMLDMIRSRIDERGVDNVTPIRGTVTDPQLPADSVDLAYMVDAYHEFSHPYEMMTALMEDLTPGGRVVLAEYRREDPSIPIKTLHKMTEAQVRKEMEAVGLEWVETKDMLPRQHFLVFRKPTD